MRGILCQHADTVSPTASVDRQSPLSLPKNISSGLAAFHASACWNSPTCALMQLVELVVFRHTQPMSRLHFHKYIRAGEHKRVLL